MPPCNRITNGPKLQDREKIRISNAGGGLPAFLRVQGLFVARGGLVYIAPW